jgi:arsenate reductase-like glutaredoxin family protein
VRKRQRFELRNLIVQPLSVIELKQLARRVGGAENLVAPKRRKEAEGLAGEALLRWLAADGARVRRPIVDTGDTVTLGFAADVQAALEEKL